jgi:hypothetical protein
MYNRLYVQVFLLHFLFIAEVGAKTVILDNFKTNNHSQWHYVSDQVMGGVSEGNLVIRTNAEESFAHLSGMVSTQNNGGFIQFRTDLKNLDKDIQGIYARVKGNNQQYFIHLRTRGTILPWQYYQSAFMASDQWQIIKLPLDSFAPSSNWLRKAVKTKNIKSLGVVAFGRDHKADLRVSEIGFY